LLRSVSNVFRFAGPCARVVACACRLRLHQTHPDPGRRDSTALEGHDLLAAAQTGTGKTAAFVLPLLQRLSTSGQTMTRRPRALILTPTRELAAQVHENLRDYGKHMQVSATTIFGGVSMGPQINALRRGVDVVIATPGR
jgi:ATP-dependent RNA helicase RhlE